MESGAGSVPRPFRCLVGIEKSDDIAGLSDDGSDALFDEPVRAIADGAGHGAGYRTDAPAEVVRGAHGRERPGPHTGLRDHNAARECSHQSVPRDEPFPRRCGARWEFAHEQAGVGDPSQELRVRGRVAAVQTGCQDGNRLSAGREHAPVRHTVDAVRASCDDHPFLIGQTRRKLVGDVFAVVGGRASARDRDAIAQRRRQERRCALSPQHIGGAVAQPVQHGGPLPVGRDQRAEPVLLGLSHTFEQIGHDPRPKTFAPQQNVGADQPRHVMIGLNQAQRRDAAVTSEDVPGHQIVRLRDHRQHDPRHPFALHLLRQRRHDRCPSTPRSPKRCAVVWRHQTWSSLRPAGQ